MDTPPPAPAAIADRELTIHRVVDLPHQRLYQAWTDPELLVQWFTPKPWTTVEARLDVRPGGTNYIVMRSPEGQEFPNQGVYLDVVPGRRLVMTDAFANAWEPAHAAFMVVDLRFDDLGDGRTDYTIRVMHWSAEDRAKHEAMGFLTGWNQCLDQMIELLKKTA